MIEDLQDSAERERYQYDADEEVMNYSQNKVLSLIFVDWRRSLK